MRIISQDGKFDIPYDEIVVEIFGDHVVGRLKEYIGRDILLGSYSTKEKCEKVVDMLHDTYLSIMELDGGYDTVCCCYVQPNYWVLPKYFRFPSDEDVEV